MKNHEILINNLCNENATKIEAQTIREYILHILGENIL